MVRCVFKSSDSVPMASRSPGSRQTKRSDEGVIEVSGRLKRCWSISFDHSLLPTRLAKVRCLCCSVYIVYCPVYIAASGVIASIFLYLQNVQQVGQAFSMPADAVLAGLIMIISFSISHSDIQVEGIDWVEPVLVWVAVCMPTGAGKSTLSKFLRSLVRKSRVQCEKDDGPFWLSDDQSFEKLGELMEQNYAKLRFV